MTEQKFIIAGRACSGKTRIAERLAKELGVPLLKTCTTRPRRTPDEDSYHFYTEEDAKSIPKSEKLFRTVAIDQYERWTRRDDFLEAGIAVLDPNGIPQAINLWHAYGHPVRLVYVKADTDTRRKAWIKRAMRAGKDRKKAVRSFEIREDSESLMFDQMEAQIQYAFGRCKSCFASEDDQHAYGEDKLDGWLNDFTPANIDALIHMLCDEAKYAQPRTGFRRFPPQEIVLERADWAEAEWTAICKMLSLSPEMTPMARMELREVGFYVDPEERDKYMQGKEKLTV
ncbi:MAG: ATP-binding protein [Ruminococcus flavefaciens]|nr:ATP-binding protein [Ruminococcus flavefaciens]